MSSILDALKKSEADRQRAAGPTLLEMRVHPRRRGLPAWAWWIGVLLVGNGALLAWLLLRIPSVAPGDAVAMSSPTAAAPAQATTSLPGPAPAPLGQAAPAQVAPAPAVPSPSASAQSPTLRASSPSRASPPAGDAIEPAGNPADDEPATEAPVRRARAATAVQNYSALSGSLPAMHLDLHFWSEVPAERYALINLHRVGEGDTLPEGPRVLEITRDGVVMDYQGREFLLGRD